MKTQTFLFLFLCFNQFLSIKSICYFRYWNGEDEFWNDDCFCGSMKEPVVMFNKYCCVHENLSSSNSCQIDSSTNGKWGTKWCPNATLLSTSHICNNNCYNDIQVWPHLSPEFFPPGNFSS